MRPPKRRRRALSALRAQRSAPPSIALAIASSVIALGALAACDTNDGRQLADPKYPLPVTVAPSTVPTDSFSFQPPPSTAPAPQGFTVLAPWQEGGEIPARYACTAEDLAPPLTWIDAPAGTAELAVTMVDPDAAGFVHWLLIGIPADRSGLIEDETPDGATVWANSFGEQGYGGPCPPAGETHRYVITVYALNQAVAPADTSSADDVIAAISQFAIASTSVTGVFVREG